MDASSSTPVRGEAADSTSPAAAAWDRAASSYDADRAHDLVYQACLATTCGLVERLRPIRLIDVGCGTGLTTIPLQRSGRTVVAVDYSRESLCLLRAKARAIPAVQADLRALPFLTASFDVVLCSNTLQHLAPAAHREAIGELRRLVAPGGHLVVTVHHYSAFKRRAGWIKEGRPGQPGIDYIYRFTADDLAELLPGASIVAMGFQEWSRLPVTVQQWLGRGPFGAWLARRGYGHMLAAVQPVATQS